MKFKSILFYTASALGLAYVAACSTSQPLHSTSANEKHVRFLHLADMHAQLDTHWEYLPEDPGKLHKMGGFARIKTALDEKRANAPGAVFTVDGGDTFQGTAVSALTKGQAIVAPLNALGIDTGVPGNWEVVYGPAAFKDLLHAVNYKVICYNFEDSKTHERVFAPATILEKNGVRVAFVGLTDPTTTTRQPPAEVKGLDSTHMDGLRSFVQNLKRTEHPDLVVLVDHTGLAPSVQLAKEIPEFDVVLSGHTHERVYKPIFVGSTIVVEPGSMGSFIGQLDITLRDGKVVGHDYELLNVDADRYIENPELKSLITEIEKPFRKNLDRVVGETKTTLMRYDTLEGTMDNLVADAVRDATLTDVGFTNGFRFSPPIAPGPITVADLWTILPLDAKLKAGKVTGKQLRSYLENEMELVFAKDPFALSGGWGPRPSGMEVDFHAHSVKGRRIRSVKIHGKEITDGETYTLGGCERDGEDLDIICRLRGVHDAGFVPGTIHTALERFIKKHSPLNYGREGRVHADDLPSKVWSQYGMLQKMWDLPGNSTGVVVPGTEKDHQGSPSQF
jgi:sulfur-oxidizing protein SoxB